LIEGFVLTSTTIRSAIKGLEPLLVIHNFILSFGSFYCLVYLIVSLYEEWLLIGMEGILCGVPRDESDWWFWCKIFYYSKFYEYLDTVFLVLRKKPLTPLHTIHHAVVAPLFWLYFEIGCTFQWIQVINNVSVHTPMYYYFGYCALNKNGFLRKMLPSPNMFRAHITSMQITQFFADIILTTIVMWDVFGALPLCYDRVTDALSTNPTSTLAMYMAYVVGFAFIYLFGSFYIEQYIRPKKGKKSAEKAAAPAKSSKSSSSSKAASASTKNEAAAVAPPTPSRRSTRQKAESGNADSGVSSPAPTPTRAATRSTRKSARKEL